MFADEHGHEMTKEEKVEEVKELNDIVSEMLWSKLRLKERVDRRKKKAELLEKMRAGFAPVKVEVNVEVTLEPEGHVEVNVAVSVKKRKQSKRRRRRHRKRVTKKEETQSEM